MRKASDADQIARVLSVSAEPMRASEIARILKVPRSRVNAILHKSIGTRFDKQLSDFTWTLRDASLPQAKRQKAELDSIKVEAHFAPEGRTIDTLCQLLGEAKVEVLVQAFYLKSQGIADALIQARKRGVRVRLLLGCTNTRWRSTRDRESRHGGRKHQVAMGLHNANVEVLEYIGDTNNHNKCVVIDTAVTVTGGMNLCDRAADNADNLVVIHSRAVAEQFRNDWHAKYRLAARFMEDDL